MLCDLLAGVCVEHENGVCECECDGPVYIPNVLYCSGLGRMCPSGPTSAGTLQSVVPLQYPLKSLVSLAADGVCVMGRCSSRHVCVGVRAAVGYSNAEWHKHH